MKPVLVYVDDMPNNLVNFETQFEDTWEVKTFTNPVECLNLLKSLDPVIIVSDQRMPGMSGVQFLEKTSEIHPNAIRIIVTGYSDEELVINSVRIAKVYDYIRKPFGDDELESRIAKAYDFYKSSELFRKQSSDLAKQNRVLIEENSQLKAKVKELEKLIKDSKN